MRLCTCRAGGRTFAAAELGERIIDLRLAHEASGGSSEDRDRLGSVLDIVRGGERALEAARSALVFAERSGDRAAPFVLTAGETRLLAPIPRPGKILCSGVNYRGHLEENPGAKLPETPFFFSKLPSAVIGPGEPIVHPAATSQLDYEVELAVVIGRSLHRARESDILPSIAGYTILHDVSARDVQFKDNQITLGKNFDTFAPMGPCLVTPEEVPDPADLRLRSLVNGRVLQDSSTRDWVFPLPVLLASLSRVMTLEPGDVVSTGTPAGVGVFRKPPVFLKPGDVVALEIERVGRLENPVVAET